MARDWIKWIKIRKEGFDRHLVVNLKGEAFIVNDLGRFIIEQYMEGKEINEIAKNVSSIYNTSIQSSKKVVEEFISNFELIIKGIKTCPKKSISYKSPLSLSLILTYRCNLSCRHCLVGEKRYSNLTDLSLEHIKKLASEAEELGIFTVVLNGGEPMVRHDFFDILEILHNHGLSTILLTNSLLLSPEKIRKMNQLGVITYRVSIEGSKRETNDLIRGHGTFEKIVENIRNLVNFSDAEIELSVTYGKHNISEIEEVVELASNLGVGSIKFASLRPEGFGKDLFELVPSIEEQVLVNLKIEKLQKLYPEIRIEGDGYRIFDKNVVCGIAKSLTIIPNGSVIPCDIFELIDSPDVILGNISDSNIEKIWNSKKAKQIRSLVKRENKKLCKICKFFENCFTYCIAEVYKECGSFTPCSKFLFKCYNYHLLYNRMRNFIDI